ncbi:DUF397 domain-containing protein [Streptomyces sp. NBC_01725]|uniref:DUF397 domain-containing protein n=1 Tax=unclassified Streptomyces TaxID=2593676 RepID=UPI0011C9D83B|nr:MULTISPECIES: DUF397 domain-containing protein [unclassified Streptomyces]TXL84647.1 DUF397 domain-containing protein [Streptomyces sp. IB2014 016-6]
MVSKRASLTQWTKSTYSANGDCVEVRALPATAVSVRDSKNLGGPVLNFAPKAWETFVADSVGTSATTL